MIRIPIGNEKSARIEVRTVSPDANPYLAIYLILQAGLKGMLADKDEIAKMNKIYEEPIKKLPESIQTAIEHFEKSAFIEVVMTENNRNKFAAAKQGVADRSPRELGTRVKNGEVWYHHEVRNQILWSKF